MATKFSQMGSGNSKSQNSPSGSHVSLQSGAGEDQEYPFMQRSDAVRDMLNHVIDARDVTSTELQTWREKFNQQLNVIKMVFLLNECLQIDDQKSILLDRTSCDLVDIMEKLVDEKPQGWQPDCENICQVLCSHISAPAIPGKLPDTKVTNLVQLNLVNIRVKSQQGLSGLLTVLQKNKSLQMIEFGFTGMKPELFQQTFTHITKLQYLTYLGLRGNRLDNSTVSTIQKSLQNTKTLPRLMWVDFANNVDIISLPVVFLNLLKQRWPSEQYQPTFSELLDGKVVVQKSQFVLMV